MKEQKINLLATYLLGALTLMSWTPSSLAESKEACSDVFTPPRRLVEIQRQLELFYTVPSPPALPAEASSQKTKAQKTQTTQETPPVEKNQDLDERRLTRKESIRELWLAFTTNDYDRVEKLIKKYPYLRDRKIRFHSGKLIDQIPEKHQAWCPQGWGLLQLASYFNDKKMMNLLIDLKVNPETLKKTGGISIEDNALHIAIKRQHLDPISLLLGNASITDKSRRRRGHFIDEKDINKQTPFALAATKVAEAYFDVQRQEEDYDYVEPASKARKSLSVDILSRVARERPSGEVEFPVYHRKLREVILMNGFKYASHLGIREISNIAHSWLGMSRDYQLHEQLKARGQQGRTKIPPNFPHY